MSASVGSPFWAKQAGLGAQNATNSVSTLTTEKLWGCNFTSSFVFALFLTADYTLRRWASPSLWGEHRITPARRLPGGGSRLARPLRVGQAIAML
jgi:hypothetical protein